MIGVSVLTLSLLLFHFRARDPHALAEESFQRLLQTTVLTPDVWKPRESEAIRKAQAEFRSHGKTALIVLEEHIDFYFSRKRTAFTLAMLVSLRQSPEAIRASARADQERMFLGIEAMGDEATALLPALERVLVRTTGRASKNQIQIAAYLIACAGKHGEKVLSNQLNNPSPEVRECCRVGLTHYLNLLSPFTEGDRTAQIDVRTWTAMAEGNDPAWRQWASQSAWMIVPNGGDAMDGLLTKMRGASLAQRIIATEALASILRANPTRLDTLRTNYVSACLEVLTDAEPSERGRAAAALASVGAVEPRVLAALERTLSDTNRMVREDAADALKKLRP